MLRFVLADLRRLWAGSVVVVLLIAMAVALGVSVTLQERALRLGSARAADKFDLVIGARGSETQLVLSTVFLQAAPLPLVSGDILVKLQDDPRVAWAAPVGFGDFYQGYPVIGTSTRLISETAPGFADGGMFAAHDQAVVGSKVRLAVGDKIVPTHGQLELGGHVHDEINYRVTGKLQPTGTPWDRAIFVPIAAVWDAHDMATSHGDHDHEETLHEHWQQGDVPGVPAILVKPRSIGDAYKLRQEYRTNETSLGVFPAEVLTKLYGMLGDARQVLAIVAIGAQSLVAAALVLVTVMHIGQRRKQISSLRAFGAPRSSIFALVWTELFTLILGGIVLGVIVGYGAATMLSQVIARKQGFDLPIEFTSGDLAGIGMLLAVSAVLAALPAIMAYRQSLVASLRN